MRYFGCGSQQSSVHQPHLSRQRLHSFIKRKIRFTEATAEVPAYYMHHYVETDRKDKETCLYCGALLQSQGLSAGRGISQVISNSVASSFENAFGIPPIFYDGDSGSRCGSDRTAKKCHSKGVGYSGSNYGSLLFCDYDSHYLVEYPKPSGCI